MRELQKSFWDYSTIIGLSVLAIPLMVLSETIQANYLGPANYGKVALVLSSISLLYLFGMNWIQLSIIRFGKEEFVVHNHIRKTISNFIIIAALLFTIVSFLFYVFKNPILDFLEITHPYAFSIIICGLFLTVCKQIILEILRVIRLIKIQSFLYRLAPKIFLLSGLLIMVFFDTVYVNYIIAVFFAVDFLIILLGLFFIKVRFIFPLVFDKKIIKTIVVFSFPLIFSSWSGYIINWIDTYVIKYFLTLEAVGIYQAAYKNFNTFNTFAISGLMTVVSPIIIVLKTENKHNKIRDVLLKRFVPQLSFLSMVGISVLILLSDFAFDFIYGNDFSSSITPFKIIIASQNIAIFQAVYSGIITSYDLTKLFASLGIFSSVINVIADIILVQKLGIVGTAISTFIVFSLNPLIWFFVINKKFNVKTPIALLFPLLTTLIAIFNILDFAYYEKLAFSFSILIVAVIIGKQFDLFNNDDIYNFNNINIPKFIRTILIKMVILLGSEKSQSKQL